MMIGMDTVTFPIIVKLGGRAPVRTKLKGVGAEVTIKGIGMWERRKRIPGHAMRNLMQIAEAEGIAYKAADFVLAQNGAASPRPAA